MECVSVSLEETSRVVRNSTSKVPDGKAGDRLIPWSFKQPVLSMRSRKLDQHCSIRRSREHGFFVDQAQNIHWPGRDHVQNVLVVSEFNALPVDSFSLVLFLFHFENVSDEKLLQVFIRKVDAQLFEGVFAEILEAEDIEKTDRVTTVGIILSFSLHSI